MRHNETIERVFSLLFSVISTYLFPFSFLYSYILIIPVLCQSKVTFLPCGAAIAPCLRRAAHDGWSSSTWEETSKTAFCGGFWRFCSGVAAGLVAGFGFCLCTSTDVVEARWTEVFVCLFVCGG